MGEQIFWVWNGWGILFTVVIGAWQFLHILVTIKLGPGSPLRNILALVFIAALVLTFVLSGWIAGVLAIPIGMTFGVVLAKIILPRPV